MLDWTPMRRTSGVKKTGRPMQMITTNGLNASIYAKSTRNERASVITHNAPAHTIGWKSSIYYYVEQGRKTVPTRRAGGFADDSFLGRIRWRRKLLHIKREKTILSGVLFNRKSINLWRCGSLSRCIVFGSAHGRRWIRGRQIQSELSRSWYAKQISRDQD